MLSHHRLIPHTIAMQRAQADEKNAGDGGTCKNFLALLNAHIKTIDAKAMFVGGAAAFATSCGITSIPNIQKAAAWVADNIPGPVTGIGGNFFGTLGIDYWHSDLLNERSPFSWKSFFSSVFSVDTLSSLIASGLIYKLEPLIPSATLDLGMGMSDARNTSPHSTQQYTSFNDVPPELMALFFKVIQFYLRNSLRSTVIQGPATYFVNKLAVRPITASVTSCVSSLFNTAKSMCFRNAADHHHRLLEADASVGNHRPAASADLELEASLENSAARLD